MEALGDLVGKRVVNHAVGLDPAFATESLGRDLHAKMTFPLRPMASMALVQVGFVHHLERIGAKSRLTW